MIDLQMPILDGIETTAIIREREKASQSDEREIAVPAADFEEC